MHNHTFTITIVDTPEIGAELDAEQLLKWQGNRRVVMNTGGTPKKKLAIVKDKVKSGQGDISTLLWSAPDEYLALHKQVSMDGMYRNFPYIQLFNHIDPASRPKDINLINTKGIFSLDLLKELGISNLEPGSSADYVRQLLIDKGDSNAFDLEGSVLRIKDTTRPNLEKVSREIDKFEDLLAQGIGLIHQGIGPSTYPHYAFASGPYTLKEAGVHLVLLDQHTRETNARDFQGEQNMPYFAITSGLPQYKSAQALRVSGYGPHYAERVIIAFGDPSSHTRETSSAGLLVEHGSAELMLDRASAALIVPDSRAIERLQNNYRRAGINLIVHDRRSKTSDNIFLPLTEKFK